MLKGKHYPWIHILHWHTHGEGVHRAVHGKL